MCEVCQGARRAGSKGHSTWPSKRELCLLTAVLVVPNNSVLCTVQAQRAAAAGAGSGMAGALMRNEVCAFLQQSPPPLLLYPPCTRYSSTPLALAIPLALAPVDFPLPHSSLILFPHYSWNATESSSALCPRSVCVLCACATVLALLCVSGRVCDVSECM